MPVGGYVDAIGSSSQFPRTTEHGSLELSRDFPEGAHKGEDFFLLRVPLDEVPDD